MLYAIVNNQKVIVGPVKWSKNYITQVLKVRHKIVADIPSEPPKEYPYVIDEHTSIYEALQEYPSIDTLFQQYHGPFWNITENPVVANYNVVELDIVSVRNNIKQNVSQERYKKENTTIDIELKGNTIGLDTSRSARDVYTQKYAVMDENSVIAWKFNNIWLDLSKQDLFNIIKSIDDHVQSTFDWEKGICDQLDSIENVSELLSVKIVDEPNPELER